MAVWYCNYGNGTNTGYYAVAQWASNHVYAAGDIVRQLATPTVGNERCFRTAAGGTSGGSEPSWTLTKGGSTSDNTVTWTEVTGNSTYNWNAPAARLQTIISSSFAAAGDTIYVGSNHAETRTGAMTISPVGTLAAPNYVYCVNVAGSVPPVTADLRTTATITDSDSTIAIGASAYIYGVTFAATASSQTITIANTGTGAVQQYDNCTFNLPAGGFLLTGQIPNKVTLTNTSINFADNAGAIKLTGTYFNWRGQNSAVTGTAPTTLFQGAGFGNRGIVTLDGVNLSALGTGTTIFGANTEFGQVNALNCRLGASVTVAGTPTAHGQIISLQIADSGATGYRQERYAYEGTLTTETTFVRSGGASDGVTPISWKVVSTANATYAAPFETFQIAIWNSTTGSAKTATIEIENGGTTFTNADVWVEVEYLGSSSYPQSSLVSSGVTSVFGATTNLPTSSVTWGGGLGSAVKQYLQVSFTPQMAGYVRATVKVAKASATLYVDPVITIA